MNYQRMQQENNNTIKIKNTIEAKEKSREINKKT
jgi:hypothetical protein